MKVGMEGIEIKGLKQFPSVEGLPQTGEEIKLALQSSVIKRIYSCVLGPLGTNISQAAKQYLDAMAISYKITVEFGNTPEECLEKSRAFTKTLPLPEQFRSMSTHMIAEGEVGIFWTCAVYYKLNELFFENPDVLPFFIQHTMRLDEMQLATREELVKQIVEGQAPKEWAVASHPSPLPLLQNIPCKYVALVNSNAAAAKKCADREVEACITTEKARQLNNLVKLHSFGSPPMVFLGGITAEGAEVIKRAYKYETASLARRGPM